MNKDVLANITSNLLKEYGSELVVNQQDLPHIVPQGERLRFMIKLSESDPKVWLFIDAHKSFAVSLGTLMYQLEAEHLEEYHVMECLKEFINIIGGNLLNQVEDSDLQFPTKIETEGELKKLESITPDCKLVASLNGEKDSEEFVLTVLKF